MHQDSSSPSFSSRNIPLVTNSFRRTSAMHYFRQVSVKFRELNLAVLFPSEGQRRSRQCRPWPLASCSSTLSLRRSVVWLDVGVDAEPSHRLRQVLRWQSFPPRPSEELSEEHRPNHQRVLRGRPLIYNHRRAVAMAWNQKTCSLPPVSTREAIPLNPRVLAKIDQT